MKGMAAADRLLAIALRLPQGERRFLARALLASVGATGDGDEDSTAEAWVREMERRVGEVLEGRATLDPVEENLAAGPAGRDGGDA